MLSLAVLCALAASEPEPPSVDSLTSPLPEVEVWRSVRSLVDMKQNYRGPYEGVAWYCNDGSVLPPRSYACTKRGGGLQYGKLSEKAVALGERGIYVGTVIASLKPEDLLANDLYRARALIVEKYLERALNGWVLTLAKTYRGFRQTEDEERAARDLLAHMSGQEQFYDTQRLLLIRLMRALGHGSGGALADQIRALAGELGDEDEKFSYIRFKIHAMPEPNDVALVGRYAREASKPLAKKAAKLAALMADYYDPGRRRTQLAALRNEIADEDTRKALDAFVKSDLKNGRTAVERGLEIMRAADKALAPATRDGDGLQNLHLLHAISLVESMWIGAAAQIDTMRLTRGDGAELLARLVEGAFLSGMLSAREMDNLAEAITPLQGGTLEEAEASTRYIARIVDWARAHVLEALGLALPRYVQVEPKAAAVVDDVLRSGVMLPLGSVLDRITEDLETQCGGGHSIRLEGVTAVTGVRGQNPGFAVGPLRILGSDEDPMTCGRSEIVVLKDLPPTLPPVAGIITVGAAGNLAHVSLLARNLGIPSASIGGDLAEALSERQGEDLVLGVSTGHRVVLATPEDLTPEERELVRAPKQAPTTPQLTIDANRLALNETDVVTLDALSEKDSGVRVGPKAAELARLKRLFPKRVSNAVVIPFGAFAAHVGERPSPEGAEKQPAEPSPLTRLRAAYGYAAELPPEEAEALVLGELELFRKAIKTLPFRDGFEEAVDAALAELGEPGSFGVFVRSDTNVEDLEEFTGAGLNKTVANRVERDDIFAAIRKVWASPFTERSYRWRQKILHNPEHVYPSVLLHRTVPSELSGVMVTADLATGDSNAITVSVSEGVAAVVDGGAPESIVVQTDGSVRLLATCRMVTQKRIPPPPAQGVIRAPAGSRDVLLTASEIKDLQSLAREVNTQIPNPKGIPWDIEFGFVEGQAWLLQIRPLRAAKSPATHPLLVALDDQAVPADAQWDPEGSLQ